MNEYRNLTLFQIKKLAIKLATKYSKIGVSIGLIGNLGSGKTTFAKAFAQAFGIKALKSPTFIVAQRFELQNRYLYHLDFYRLRQLNELEVLGLDEILSGNNLVLIEWVDKFPTLARKCDILISLLVKKGNKRDVSIKYK